MGRMKTLHLLVQISTILALASCAPYQTNNHYYGDLDQETENLQQTQDKEDLFDDSQQQTQVEDLHQYQQGKLPEDFHSGRLEDFDSFYNSQQSQKQELPPDDYEQQSHVEELNQQSEQLGQLKLEPEQFQQNQDHEDFFDDSQQKTQAEDLHQYQSQGPVFPLPSRLETFDSHVEEVNQYPEQQGQIKVEEENENVHDTQQTQDHGNLFEDSQQQVYNEELNQYGQEQVVQSHPKYGRLEDLGEDSEIFQQSQTHDVQSEDLNQQQAEDLSQYTQEQEPKIPKLEISQLRHEQQPKDIKDSLHEDVYIPSESDSPYFNDAGQEEVHEQDQTEINYSNSKNEHFEIPHVITEAPGFWEKLKHKAKSAINKVKEAGRDLVHRVKEKIY